MTKIHILTAEHFHVPGLIVRAYRTYDNAEREAVELVNIMLKDSGKPQDATRENWLDHHEALQSEYGAAHCYVVVDELELLS